MIKTKFMKAVMLGLCVSALSAGVAFAGTVDSKSPEVTTQNAGADSEEAVLYATGEAAAPDTAVSSELIDNSLVTRQDEVNKALFEDKASELETKGISIMYTTPLDGYVEVGIRPYNEDNAKFIYGLTGKDMVKVVEGKEPELMATSGLAADDVMTTTTAKDGKEPEEEGNIEVVSVADETPVDEAAAKDNNVLPVVGIAGVAALLGGVVAFSQKKKISR